MAIKDRIHKGETDKAAIQQLDKEFNKQLKDALVDSAVGEVPPEGAGGDDTAEFDDALSHLSHRIYKAAGLCKVYGKLDEAARYFKRELDNCERKLSKKHPNTLSSMDNLALVYAELERYEEADKLFQDALALHEVVSGHSHIRTMDTINNFAILKTHTGDLKVASQLYERARKVNCRGTSCMFQ